MSEIPNDWIPMGEIEETSRNPDGGTYLKISNGNLHIIRYNEHKENDVIRFFKSEIPHLQHRLVDYMNGDLKHD